MVFETLVFRTFAVLSVTVLSVEAVLSITFFAFEMLLALLAVSFPFVLLSILAVEAVLWLLLAFWEYSGGTIGRSSAAETVVPNARAPVSASPAIAAAIIFLFIMYLFSKIGLCLSFQYVPVRKPCRGNHD